MIGDGELCESMTTNSMPRNDDRSLQKRRFHVTMEIPVFLVYLAAALSGAVIFNILLYRTCVVTLNHEEDKCRIFLKPERSNDTKTLEDEVQRYTMFICTVKLILESLIPAVLSFFLGSWSDKHGRLPLILIPLLGMALSTAMVVIYSMMKNLGPWWFLLTSIPFSLTGGYAVLFTGAYCYVSDVTSTENRSLRMTILDAVTSFAIVLGSVASPYLVKHIGSTYLLTLVAALFVAGYVFTQICLIESVENPEKGNLGDILQISLVRDMIQNCFMERPNNLRAILLLLIFANSISSFVFYGLFNLEYLYMRLKLHWSMEDFTLYSAVDTAISLAGNFLGIAVVQKILRLDDITFSILSFFSIIVRYVITIKVVSTWQMYYGSGISLFKGLSTPLIRSVVTKIIPIQDVAKALSLMGALNGICPLLSPMIFNSLYAATVTTFPMSIYMLSIGFTTVSVGMLGLAKYYKWKFSYEALQETNSDLVES